MANRMNSKRAIVSFVLWQAASGLSTRCSYLISDEGDVRREGILN